MCGIFLYSGTHADPVKAGSMIRQAAGRGPHGHGWYTRAAGPRRFPGPLGRVSGWDGTTTALVHTRLATYGRPEDAAGLQPVLTGGGDVLVHNGNIYNWEDLDEDAASDSWALGKFYSDLRDSGDSPEEAFSIALWEARYEALAVILWDRDGLLLAARKRLPLNVLKDETGIYAGSGWIQGCTDLPDEKLITLGEAQK